MIDESRRMKRKKLMYQPDCSPASKTITNDMPIMKMHKNFESLLISRSILPTLVIYSELFIPDLVSLPVYTTSAWTWPADAKTVLAQSVFSRERGSFASSLSSSMLVLKKPLKS